MSEDTKEIGGLVGEVAALPDGKEILSCIQCGMCTATCPVAEAVPGFSPREIIARALLNLEQELLASDEIWYCARCQECVAVCRKNIRPGDIITAIRTVALSRAHRKSPGARHTVAFLSDIRKKGKLNEATLPLKTLGWSSFSMAPYALRLLLKRKVPPPMTKTIEGIDEVRSLIEEYKR